MPAEEHINRWLEKQAGKLLKLLSNVVQTVSFLLALTTQAVGGPNSYDVERAKVVGDCIGCALENVDFSGSVFERGNFDEVVVDKAKGTRVNWRRAYMDGAKLSESDLSESDFVGANLNGTFAHKIKFAGSNFSWAKLTKVSFHYVDCTGANFKGAKLKGASLRSVVFDGANFEGADLDGILTSNCSFKGATFKNAKIRGGSGICEMLIKRGAIMDKSTDCQ